MKIYYIEDKNGNYISANSERRFTRLDGIAGYMFLKSTDGKGRRFMKLSNKSGSDETYIEVHDDDIKQFRKYERHEQYVSDLSKKYGYEILSLDYEETADGVMLSEAIGDADVNVENEVIHQLELETLRKALKTLTENEYALISALFLQEQPMSEREYSELTGIPQKTINDRKKRILKKLKTYF